MGKGLNDEGYEIVLSGRALRTMDRSLGYGCVGRKHRFGAPGDYSPGATDDRTQGYAAGSRLSNQAGEVFICVDPAAGKANWVKIAGIEDATPSSWVNKKDSDPAPEPSPPATDSSQTSVQQNSVDSTHGVPASETNEGGPLRIGVEGGPRNTRTAVPDEMPWSAYIDKIGIETIEELQQTIDEGGLVDKKYMNADRVKDIARWLEDN